ncbi:hypothetical protein CC77DRAFT_1091473 [Alternaria alternata]|uniref:Uncharacterized protein n=2 Tax=Alternaria alternata complex TaxID=187734 RepID=A0A177DYG6_ALTAL|nr:hypothetical protein CC77DRAFT_1091473 [Alternaria alternata]RYN36538.1 hypothetical protein AA0115_g1605 [Alternaria tenuissima]KAH6859981.1 hypothetical protein B0T12DRAFT_126019 [Alternaria alternata]OAG24536.1 hypothetical protein CC77DRAFT_1091473 [Alternaria alternata]RYN44414.1 hypothetical protein AA0114_g9979 [Alternaria tenuissima]RYN88224.1 hypothetical protein AA0119_g12063 [Alternaria tenuissima]
MHDAAPASHDPPPAPPPADTFQPDHHHHHHDPDHDHNSPVHLPPHEYPPPDEPPPSYDDAVGMTGAPPGYGTFRPYSEESSIASSEVESTHRALPEWFGQALVVFIFICLIYGFWEFINTPDVPSEWPGNGHFRPSGT